MQQSPKAVAGARASAPMHTRSQHSTPRPTQASSSFQPLGCALPCLSLRQYPDLVAFHAHISELPGIKEYLASDKRSAKVNGNGLG
jgi:hypothetical protein